jgi:signal transduction histidine kinase
MEEFSYTVSHDLRAPLRSINGYAGVLLQDFSHRLKGDAVRYLERIVENGHRMERLVNDVLTISRMANIKLKLERVDLRLMIESIVREYPNLQPSEARIQIGPIPAVIGHESLCVQVFSNLLSNAAKFTTPGVTPRIRVSAERFEGVVKVSVRDNGIGVSPEYHQKIFGMFERLDPDNRYTGTGIGLAIVRRAVEKMNGRVGVDSDGRNGSCFWVELPAASTAHEPS